MKWTRVKDISSYVKSEDLAPAEDDTSLARRVYSPKGKKYPLFCIGIYANPSHVVRNYPFAGLKVGFSFKRKAGDWWDSQSEDTYLPKELFDEFKEILEEAFQKVKNL